MFDKVRVLVVDDSALMRMIIKDIINSQPDMEVIDTARDGNDAIKKVYNLEPDVVTLDVEMPEKNGIEALKEIKNNSKSEVIMLSSLTSEGSKATIDALRIGAFDFIQKPSGSLSLDIEKISKELVEKIRYAFNKSKIKNKSNPLFKTPYEKSRINETSGIKAVLIGASTGGPRVLYEIITSLPASIGIPIFVVQHMPAGFTSAFAKRMDSSAKLSVVEASDGENIISDRVYIAPGGYHMTIDNNTIKLDTSPPIHGVKPSVDKLFFSAANIYGGSLMCCVLTGMGKDGAEGLRFIKSKGGYTISQDEESSTVYGMPRAAFETGCVDMVLSYKDISKEIIRVVKRTWFCGFFKGWGLCYKGIRN